MDLTKQRLFRCIIHSAIRKPHHPVIEGTSMHSDVATVADIAAEATAYPYTGVCRADVVAYELRECGW